MLNLSTFYCQMMNTYLKKTTLLLVISFFFIVTGCETTSTSNKVITNVLEKTEKKVKLEPEFELITTYRNINKVKKDFGNFSLERVNDGMSLYRLDRGSCRVFIQSKENADTIQNIMVFHLGKKKFFPKFNLRQCVS